MPKRISDTPDNAWDASSDEDDHDHDWDNGHADSTPSNTKFLEAAKAITEFLRNKYMTTDTLPANEFCKCCYWLNDMGAQVAEPYALRPNQPTGHYQRHLDLIRLRLLTIRS